MPDEHQWCPAHGQKLCLHAADMAAWKAPNRSSILKEGTLQQEFSIRLLQCPCKQLVQLFALQPSSPFLITTIPVHDTEMARY
jgi:hypothetical protein